jgi:hypothetical protein
MCASEINAVQFVAAFRADSGCEIVISGTALFRKKDGGGWSTGSEGNGSHMETEKLFVGKGTEEWWVKDRDDLQTMFDIDLLLAAIFLDRLYCSFQDGPEAWFGACRYTDDRAANPKKDQEQSALADDRGQQFPFQPVINHVPATSSTPI